MLPYTPYKSQSHELNDFYRRTVGRLTRISNDLDKVRIDLKHLTAMTKVQVAAATRTANMLSAAAQRPVLQSNGLFKHDIPAVTFVPVSHAVVDGNVILTRAASAESRLFALLTDGTPVIPSALRVEVEPGLSGQAYETDPLGAIGGHVPWWRRIPSAVFEPSAQYTVYLARALGDLSVNELRFTTFPATGVTVSEILLRQGSRWIDFPGSVSHNEGEVVCLCIPIDIDAVRIRLTCTALLSVDGVAGYNLGLAGLNVLRTVACNERTEIYTTAALSGSGPWTVHTIDVDAWPTGSWQWRIQDGNKYYTQTDLPFSVYHDNLGIHIVAEPSSIRSMFRQVSLTYQPTV